MKDQEREVKPWSPWPITDILNAALRKALLYIQPLIILRIISTTLLRIHNFPAIIHRRVGRRERVLAWLNIILTERNIPNIQTVWRDGSILCSVIDSTIPGLDFPDRSSLKLAQNFAFLYLGVPPAFTDEEVCQETFYPHLERRLVRYLCSLQSAIARHPSLPLPVRPDPTPPSSSCLARGMGLITAAQYDRAHFYLYLLDSNLALGEISVELQSNEDFGFARIDHKCSTSAPRKFANIPIRFVLNSNSLRINYTPQSSGMHQLSILRKSFHIQGSPFSVPVEKNDPKLSCKTHTQDRRGTPRKKLRVLLRIVDFVTEKMLLTEDGKLESISAQDFLQFQETPRLLKMDLVGKQGERDQSADVSSAGLKLNQPAAHDSHTNSWEHTLDALNNKCLQRQVSVRSTCESPVRERKTSDKQINKGSEFKTRCKKIVAACHFIMNHGSKQKRFALLNAAGQILDGRPVTLGEDIEQLLRIVPSISIEDTDDESIPVVISPTEDTELTGRVGETSVDNAGDILDNDLFELQETHPEIIEDPPWDETTALEGNNRPLMFVENMFNDTDAPDLKWYSGEHDNSLNTQKGPASSSSPCYNAVETASATFTDIDAYLSKDFTAYMTSETQFHLWPSDVAFGDQCQPSTSEEEALVDFDAVLAAPNLEEALNKLEQGLKKKKAKRDEKMVESDTGEELRSSTFGNGALNSQQSEEMPLINLEEDSFDPPYNEKEDDNSAVLAMNEVQLKEQELTSTAEENRYISSDITEGAEGDESTDYFSHGYLKTFACKDDLAIKPHTFDDEHFTLFSEFVENNLQNECVNQSATNDDTNFEETPPCSIPLEDTFEVNEEAEDVQEDGPPPAYDQPPDHGQEYYESDEEELGPPHEGDSAYLSIDDIQNSFGYSPENLSNDDPGQDNHKPDKVTNPLDFEDAEIHNWNQNSNLAITGFMGPAERDVLGICDNEEIEDSLHVNWQTVLRYTRVLTPLAIHMSAIAEEEERGNESGGDADVETEDSLNPRDTQEDCNEAMHDKSNSSSPNIDKEVSHIPVLNLPGLDNEEVNQELQKEDVPSNIELLIQNTNSNQENCASLCVPHDTLNTDFQRDETLFNFIYVDAKKQVIEIEGSNIITSINEIIDANAMENYVSETTVESSEPLVELDDDYARLEKTVDDVNGTNGADIERTNSDPFADEATLVKSNSKEDTATQALDSLEMIDNEVINDVNVSGNLIDGFPVAMKVKLRKEYWDKKLLEGNQSIHLKKNSHSQITNTQSKMKSNFLSLGAKNESEELHDKTKTAKTGGETSSEDKSDSPAITDKLVEKDKDRVIENDSVVDTTRKYWNNVLERSVSPPVEVRSPSLHHARPVIVNDDCDDECPTPPNEPEHKNVVSRDLVNQRRSQQIISTVNNPRFQKINKEEIRSRFEKAKHFFQSLEHNSMDDDASSKSWDENTSRKRRVKRKKPCKAVSAPSSDSETAARTVRQAGSTIGGSERIKVAERFHVKDLFKDVTGGHDAGFMQGVPHRAAVLRALQSMEMERPVSPYEDADYCCPHDYHSQRTTLLFSKRTSIEEETIYFV